MYTYLKLIIFPTLCNTSYHQENQMADEPNTHSEKIIDKVLNRVYALAELQAEAPQVKAVQ